MAKKRKLRIEPEQTVAPVVEKEEKPYNHPGETEGDHPKVLTTLVGNLDDALNEDITEINESPELQKKSKATKKKGSGKRAVSLVIGVFMLVMSVVGIISTINFTQSLCYDIANRTALKNEFATYLYPVVAIDPPPFTTITELPSSTIVSAAVWSIILKGDNARYEKTYNTYMTVPAVDVEAAARSLFGYGFEVEHQTIFDVETSFEYSSETNTYTVPISPRNISYSPVIEDITNVGELYTVTVDYMSPSPLSIAGMDYVQEPVKTVIYTISRSVGKMTINSIAYKGSANEPHEY